MTLLEIENLSVSFPAKNRVVPAVDRVSLSVNEGEVLGIVGESGSGKSVSMLAVMGLVSFPGIVRASRLSYCGRDLLKISSRERRKIAGKDIAMIFQDPNTSLNPSFSVGFQVMETLQLHEGLSRKAARGRSAALFALHN